MSIFMFLLLPLMLCLYCFCYRENKNLPLICIGIMSSVIVCVVRMLFFFPHRIIPFSFADNFVYFLLKECCLPAVVLYLIFFLISKDPMEYKINGIFPLEISFYIVYLPYTLINSSSGFNNPFSLIIKPIIYVVMFAASEIFAREAYRLLKGKNKIWLAVIYLVLILIYVVMPAFIESIYLMNSKLWLSILLALCYVAYPCTYAALKIKNKIM